MGAVSHRALSTSRSRAIAVALAVALTVAMTGCGGSQTPAGKPRPTVTFSVSPSATCNRGRPLHAIVRAVTLKQFVEDQDRSVAQLVVSPDDSVLASFVVFPGIDQTIAIDQPAKGAIAVYFLFTGATGTSWKQLFDPPPAKIQLDLGDNEIARPRS
jgi:predicted component of type VI protein secretion system